MKMRFCIILLAVLEVFQYVKARELHPEGEAAKLARNNAEEFASRPDEPPAELYYNSFDDDTASKAAQQNAADIQWFKTNIAKEYGFVENKRGDTWETQGKFAEVLSDKKFEEAAMKAKEFFKRNNDWNATKSNPQFRDSSGKCKVDLLYITAARYVLVTYALWLVSDKKLTQCKRNKNNKNVIPTSVCYPEPYGTASCTSDYDVGLIGKDSGFLTVKFNSYFQENFGEPSEIVFDTNVYAFTLEYAMPLIFEGLPPGFPEEVQKEETTTGSKMQEIASAYYKVYKYNEDFFTTMSATGLQTLSDPSILRTKMNEIEVLDKATPLSGIPNLRQNHNNKYQEFVKSISELGGFKEPKKNLDSLAKALLYAAEAYHTRGAIRHVVGGTQMKLPQFDASKLPVNDLLVSMIENWGETNKEYNHCKNQSLEVCLLKMSKYMWRMFAAMKFLRKSLPGGQAGGLISFAGLKDPETMMSYWLDQYKRKGKNRVSSNADFVNAFFEHLGCLNVCLLPNKPGQHKPPVAKLSAKCMAIINRKVDMYNKKILSSYK